jgi:hypothetical protein
MGLSNDLNRWFGMGRFSLVDLVDVMGVGDLVGWILQNLN